MLLLLLGCQNGGFTAPPGDTLLTDVKPDDHLAVCEALAVARPLEIFRCDGAVYIQDALTEADALDACLQSMGQAEHEQCVNVEIAQIAQQFQPLGCSEMLAHLDALDPLEAFFCLPQTLPRRTQCPWQMPSTPTNGATDAAVGRITWFAPPRENQMASWVGWSPTADGPTASVTVNGVSAAGTLPIRGEESSQPTIEWVPAEPFPPGSHVEATLTHCEGLLQNTVAFTTDGMGLTVEDPTSLVGGVFMLDVFDPGVLDDSPLELPDSAQLLVSQGEPGPYPQALIEVRSVTLQSLELLHATSTPDGTGQDLCVPTQTTTASFTNPNVELVLDLPVVGGALVGVGYEATFDPQAQTLVGSLEGLVDTAPVGPSFAGGPEGFCLFLETIGAECLPCPSGEERCFDLRLANVPANRSSMAPLIERSAAQVQADVACQ